MRSASRSLPAWEVARCCERRDGRLARSRAGWAGWRDAGKNIQQEKSQGGDVRWSMTINWSESVDGGSDEEASAVCRDAPGWCVPGVVRRRSRQGGNATP